MRLPSGLSWLLAILVAAFPSRAVAGPDPIHANQNRASAGTLRNGVLSVRLEVREGFWRPQSDAGDGILIHAFGEVGKPLQIPGPLLRVRSGTRIQITLRNGLRDELVIHGLHARPGTGADTIHIAPGATRSVDFEAGSPGTYYYWGTTAGLPIEDRDGEDSQLTGAFIIDPARGPIAEDRVFVLGLWFSPEVAGAEPQPEREIMVINGKSWPDTERFTYTVGDSVRWRWINPTASSHPMHLHGFYFRTTAMGDGRVDSAVPLADQHLLATQLMLAGTTMDMRWRAEREGNWVFHCHFAFHVSDELYLAPKVITDHASHGSGSVVAHAMAGLVLGIHILPNPSVLATKSSQAPRKIRLLVQERTDTAFQGPRLGYALSEDGPDPQPDSMNAPGPLLVLRRGEPVAITVVNQLSEPTAVHWHGIELESFPDGVPGWSGTPARIMPPIAPRDSFVAEFIPPRAGTFIYHSHSNELGQILGGLVGPLVVLADADRLDEQRERVFLISALGATLERSRFGLVNGRRSLRPMELTAGSTYRFRFVNIGDWRVLFTLLDDRGFPPVKMVAKDGADLAQPVSGPLNMLTGPGETGDFEVTLEPGNYRLEFKQQLAGWIIPLELKVRSRP